MSKSYGNVIPLFASRDELAKCVMGIVTDSSGERPENVYAIHTLVRSETELGKMYDEHRGNYKMLKELLIEDLDRYLAPLRAKYEELASDPSIVEEVLEAGKREARCGQRSEDGGGPKSNWRGIINRHGTNDYCRAWRLYW